MALTRHRRNPEHWYLPRAVTRVRGGLSSPNYDGVNPNGLPSYSSSPSGGTILGLVAPLTGVAVSSSVAKFDPSGLVRAGAACHNIARQSGSQPEAHTALSATVGLLGPLSADTSRVTPSCGRAHAHAHTRSHRHASYRQVASPG